MREILFRGRQKDGKWIFGSLIHRGDYCCILPPDGVLHDSYEPYMDPELGTFDGKAIPVDPETVGQYTGINDCHKAKIFEGDILEGLYFNPDNGYGTVEFDDGAFTVENSSATATFHENIWGREVEIIGNIHDNPYLLKEGDADA